MNTHRAHTEEDWEDPDKIYGCCSSTDMDEGKARETRGWIYLQGHAAAMRARFQTSKKEMAEVQGEDLWVNAVSVGMKQRELPGKGYVRHLEHYLGPSGGGGGGQEAFCFRLGLEGW